MKKVQSLIFIFVLSLISSVNLIAQSYKTDDIVGVWLNEEKEGRIEIYKNGNQYFGKIIWLKEPNDKETGKPKVDKKNPEAKLRNIPILGLVVMKNFKFNGENEWEDGSIYDPKSGSTYNCYIQLENRNTLKVRGYIGKSWMGLGRTTHWTRIK